MIEFICQHCHIIFWLEPGFDQRDNLIIPVCSQCLQTTGVIPLIEYNARLHNDDFIVKKEVFYD